MLGVKSCNHEVEDISKLLFTESDLITPWSRFIDPDQYDFTKESVKILSSYLRTIRTQNGLDDVWNLIVLRCGTYLGEVIRKNCKEKQWHWICFDEAELIEGFASKKIRKTIATVFVLFNGDSDFLFPLAKVEKYLENGEQDNVEYFANHFLV